MGRLDPSTTETLPPAPTRHLGANKGYASKTNYYNIKNHTPLVQQNVGWCPTPHKKRELELALGEGAPAQNQI